MRWIAHPTSLPRSTVASPLHPRARECHRSRNHLSARGSERKFLTACLAHPLVLLDRDREFLREDGDGVDITAAHEALPVVQTVALNDEARKPATLRMHDDVVRSVRQDRHVPHLKSLPRITQSARQLAARDAVEICWGWG